MLVKAKCIMEAWDSIECLPYKPGQGPLPDGLYEIERDGPLAQLKTPRGNYVFEFDRNAGPDDKPHDYSCKKCGKKHKTLAALGTHTKTDHKDDVEPPEDPEDEEPPEEPEEPVVKDGRGKKKGKTFTCKTPGCGAVLPNLYALKVHKKTHEEAAVTQAA